jgi:hypothetical protein
MQFIMLSQQLPGRNFYIEFMNVCRINILYHLPNYYLTEDICNSDVICFLGDRNLTKSMKQRPSLEADTGARFT